MEQLEVEGLVLRQVNTGESDEILTILTPDHGKLSVSAKGARNFRSKHASSAQVFTYSNFLLQKTKRYYYIVDSYYKEGFEGIRYDAEKLALATYLVDIAAEFALEDVPNPNLMQVTLNALYALAYRTDIPLLRTKAAYEFRLLCEEGFAPELYECGMCHGILEEGGYLDVMNGRVLCRSCQESYIHSLPYEMDNTTAKIHVRVTPAVLSAMRYIVSSPIKRFLSFTMDEAEEQILSVVCERYLVNHLEHSFPSLEYYHMLVDFMGKLPQPTVRKQKE